MQLSQQVRTTSSRKCGKCSQSLEYGSDLCLTCGEFIKGTVVCNDCNTPTQESTACTGLCRGYAVLLCTPSAGKRTFRSPTPADVQRGLMRSKRLNELRELRASAASSARLLPGGATPLGKGKGKGKGKGRGAPCGGDGIDGRGNGSTGVGMVGFAPWGDEADNEYPDEDEYPEGAYEDYDELEVYHTGASTETQGRI